MSDFGESVSGALTALGAVFLVVLAVSVLIGLVAPDASIDNGKVEEHQVVTSGVALDVDSSALLPGAVMKANEALILHVPILDQEVLSAINSDYLRCVPVDVAHDNGVTKLRVVCLHAGQGRATAVASVNE